MPDQRGRAGPDGLLLRGIAALQSGRPADAVEPLREAVEQGVAWPEPSGWAHLADARLNLAAALHRTGRASEAGDQLRALLAEYPGHAMGHYNLGNVLADLGQAEDAEASYRRALALEQEHVPGLVNLGATLHGLGRPGEAAEQFRLALALEPDSADALTNLGLALQDLGGLDEAAACLRRVLEVMELAEPADRVGPEEWAEAHYRLGSVLQDLGQAEPAEAHLRRSLVWCSALDPNLGTPPGPGPDLEPCLAAAHGPLSGSASGPAPGPFPEPAPWPSRDRISDPIPGPDSGPARDDAGNPAPGPVHDPIFCPTVPEAAEPLYHLALLLMEQGRADEAVRAFRGVLGLDPEDARARHFLAALTGRDVPAAMEPDMVAGLYDQYADRFDAHLVDELGYRMPDHFRTLMDELGLAGPFAVLDLGCGTGGCGVRFRGLARRLVGVDLSSRMLERARERGVYDELQAGEMLETMADLARDAAGRETPFDLILAADVLIYLGDLGPFFAACRTALAQREGRGGYVLVSTEGLADGEAGAGQEYVLRPTGRYAHAPAYVGAAAGRSGFRVAARRTVPLRWHGQVMLPGDVFLLCLEG